jgi:polysaccharide biosynthesis/export protein
MKTPTRLRATLCLALASVTGLPALAQNPAPTQNPTNAGEQLRTIAYRITPTDRIAIVVIGEPELNVASKRVDAGGNIGLALLPTPLHLAGLTTSEAQAAIETAYKEGRILRSPQVSINIEEYAPREVSISGPGIKQQGKFSLPPETVMTVKDLVLKAGGFTDIAKGGAVTVTRTMANGLPKTFELDIAGLLKGRTSKRPEDQHFALESGDIVYVPEKII